MNEESVQVINVKSIFRKVFAQKKLYLVTLSVTVILSAVYIFSIPRFYTTDTELAPESEVPNSGGGISSLASSFGINLNNNLSVDAITPELYPELLKDNKFMVELLNIHVTPTGSSTPVSFYSYLANGQKSAWWSSMFSKKIKPITAIRDSYNLTREQSDFLENLKNKITMSVDIKTNVITITATDQDPLVCKTLADSVRVILQNYITHYRTQKCRNDVEYYSKLVSKAKDDYVKSRQLYGSFSDMNSELILESVRAKQEDLENEMQLKYNAYNSYVSQLQAAKAKLQERTPAFTLLKGAVVPIRPAGPKRVMFVAIMFVLAFFCTTIWVLRTDIPKIIFRS